MNCSMASENTMVTMAVMVAVVTEVPLGLVIPDAVESHLGSSVTADRVASGIDSTWWEEFQTQSRGVARTLQPRTLELAAVLVHFGDLLDAQPLDGSVVMAVAAHVIVWAFFVGGLLDRLARQQRVGSVGFLAACGVYFGPSVGGTARPRRASTGHHFALAGNGGCRGAMGWMALPPSPMRAGV